MISSKQYLNRSLAKTYSSILQVEANVRACPGVRNRFGVLARHSAPKLLRSWARGPTNAPLGHALNEQGLELATKLDHEDFARQETSLDRHDPLRLTVEPAMGDQYMEVEMGLEFLVPSVQRSKNPRLGPEVFGICQ